MRAYPAGSPVKASLIAGVIQIAILGLVVWGLLFRTRQTLALLALLSWLRRRRKVEAPPQDEDD